MIKCVTFVFYGIINRNKKALILNDYHGWFENLVGDWIDVAASKCNLEIKRAVTALDEVRNFTYFT